MNRDKQREYDKKYRVANGDKRRAYMKAYYASNRENILEQSKAYHAANRDKRLEYSAAYYVSNRERFREYRIANRDKFRTQDRARRLAQGYGLTIGDYEDMYLALGGHCQICGCYKDKLFVDHNHDTGAVRGLLCKKCNSAIGLLQDNLELLIRAADYVRTANALQYDPQAEA